MENCRENETAYGALIKLQTIMKCKGFHKGLNSNIKNMKRIRNIVDFLVKKL